MIMTSKPETNLFIICSSKLTCITKIIEGIKSLMNYIIPLHISMLEAALKLTTSFIKNLTLILDK